MNRRGFFQKAMQFAAVVALAPQLCFRPKPQLDLDYMMNELYKIKMAREQTWLKSETVTYVVAIPGVYYVVENFSDDHV
jgi:hypothetical protein